MGIGSGLGGQFMFAEESVWGTAATVSRSQWFDDESVKFQKKSVQGQGIAASAFVEQGSLRGDVASWVAGDVNMDHTTKNMGLFWKHALGNVVTAQQGGTAAYKHTFTLGTTVNGKGLTLQFGRPTTDGTVRPVTYAGCKINQWSVSAAATDIVKFKMSVLGQTRATATALGTASYPTSNNILRFSQGAITVGGTPWIAVRDFTVSGDNQLSPDRFYFGNAGLFAEPLRQGFTKVTGQFTADAIDTSIGDAFVADSELAIVLTFTGVQIASGQNELLVLTVNGIRLNADEPTINGPAILNQAVTFDALIPKAGGNAIQVDYETLDTTP